MNIIQNIYILVYPRRYVKRVHIDNKPVWISKHAVKQAEKRHISWPDQVYACLQTGKIVRFGKKMLRIIKRTKDGEIICIGEDLGQNIVIRTITRK